MDIQTHLIRKIFQKKILINSIQLLTALEEIGVKWLNEVQFFNLTFVQVEKFVL